MKKHELRSQSEELRSRIVELSEKDDITEEENVELDATLEQHEARTAELETIEARDARVAAAREKVVERAAGYDAPQIMKRTETELNVATASRSQIRDAALADLEDSKLPARNGDHVDMLLRTRNGNCDGTQIAKRMLLTGDKIDGREAERIGLVHKAVPADRLDAEVEALAERISTVPINQLMMQKLVINQAVEAMGMHQTQMFATVFDGITRHSPEGINFKQRSEEVGWKQAVDERDRGVYDWTEDRPINRGR